MQEIIIKYIIYSHYYNFAGILSQYFVTLFFQNSGIVYIALFSCKYSCIGFCSISFNNILTFNRGDLNLTYDFNQRICIREKN